MARPHGVSGRVVVVPETDAPDLRFAPGATVLTGDGSPLTVRSYEPSARLPLVWFEGIDDRAGAEALAGCELYVSTADRRPLGPDEFWPDELEGLEVRHRSGAVLGTVVRVEAGAQDRLVLEVDGRTVEVPFVEELVRRVEIAAGFVEVDPPPGLMD